MAITCLFCCKIHESRTKFCIDFGGSLEAVVGTRFSLSRCLCAEISGSCCKRLAVKIFNSMSPRVEAKCSGI